MSAARWVRRVGKLSLSLVGSLLGWLVVVPIALLIPKRRDWIAVIGKQEGRFLDNAKYFFLQASSVAPDLRLVWVTESRETAAHVRDGGYESLLHPTRQSCWFLLRCGSVLVDEAAWFRRGRFFLLRGAAVVQLWHGVGIKYTELSQWRRERARFGWASSRLVLLLRLAVYRFTGRRMRYAAVACTSRFYRDNVFRPAFAARCFPLTGYPRNDFGISLDTKGRALAWRNVDRTIAGQLANWQEQGRRLVIVAPTFRESGTVPMQLDAANLANLDAFADANAVEFVFKFHPFERGAAGIAGRHFHVCDRDSDLYPLLPSAAALVTDYSSISMDFLLVDKPLLFLIPTGDDYAYNDRQLQFDPRTMMPGPVVPDWSSLLVALLAEWGNDAHAGERAALRRKAFDDMPQSDAVPKLISLMRERGWIAAPKA